MSDSPDKQLITNKLGDYGSIIISTYCMTIFLVGIIIAWMSKNDGLLQLVVGAIVVNASNVIGYWVGSSRGSVEKSQTIAEITTPKKENAV